MQVPLTESEYAILDYLADGAQPLTWLVRELHGGKQSWDTTLIVNSLARLVEQEFIRYCQTPGGPPSGDLTVETISAQVASILDQADQQGWLEMTEQGQTTWETWQQSQPGS